MSTSEQATAIPLELGRKDHGRLVTAEAFAAASYKEPWKYERVKGRLVVMAPDGYGHIAASNPWRDRLIFYQYEHPGVVEEVITNAWIRVDDGTDRIGDIGVYLVRQEPGPQIPDRVPELMFEIVSPSPKDRKRDYVEKRAEYHKLGIQEYVIVDRFKKRTTVLEYEPDGYRERVLTPGDTYETPRLPGLAIRLAEVLGA